MSQHIDNFVSAITRPALWIPSAVALALAVTLLGWWEWLEPFTGVLTMAAAVVAVAQTHKAKVSVTRSASAGPLTIVNMSGHPLQAFEAEWGAGALMVNAATQFDASSTDALRESILGTILGLPQEIRARLLAADPNVIVVPPNLPAGIQLMDAILHGIVGEFVRISWSRRVEGGGFVWMKPVDRQALRLEMRHRIRTAGNFGE